MGPRYSLRERHIGEFERSFTFPALVEADDLKASLAHGLLKIVVPKKLGKGSAGRRIPLYDRLDRTVYSRVRLGIRFNVQQPLF